LFSSPHEANFDRMTAGPKRGELLPHLAASGFRHCSVAFVVELFSATSIERKYRIFRPATVLVAIVPGRAIFSILAAILGREKWAKIGLVEKRKNRATLFQV
jgi:hypothetical protein